MPSSVLYLTTTTRSRLPVRRIVTVTCDSPSVTEYLPPAVNVIITLESREPGLGLMSEFLLLERLSALLSELPPTPLSFTALRTIAFAFSSSSRPPSLWITRLPPTIWRVPLIRQYMRLFGCRLLASCATSSASTSFEICS